MNQILLASTLLLSGVFSAFVFAQDQGEHIYRVCKAGETTDCVDTPPTPLKTPDPYYTEEARRAKYQGTVMVATTVGTDGKTHDVHAGHNLGYGLDKEAEKAVKNWRFKPAMLNGKPVAAKVQVEVNFRLY